MFRRWAAGCFSAQTHMSHRPRRQASPDVSSNACPPVNTTPSTANYARCRSTGRHTGNQARGSGPWHFLEAPHLPTTPHPCSCLLNSATATREPASTAAGTGAAQRGHTPGARLTSPLESSQSYLGYQPPNRPARKRPALAQRHHRWAPAAQRPPQRPGDPQPLPTPCTRTLVFLLAL